MLKILFGSIKIFSVVIITALLGILFFNLFFLNNRLRMLNIAEAFHTARASNDKSALDNLLTEDFAESGWRPAVQTSDYIFKGDVQNSDRSGISTEIKYPLLLTALNSDVKSLSFIRKETLNQGNEGYIDSMSVHVTYFFEESADGLKIRKIERNFPLDMEHSKRESPQ